MRYTSPLPTMSDHPQGTHHLERDMKPSLLEQLRKDWTDRGWNPDHLEFFRMEDPPDPPPPPPDPPKTFSQAEVTAIATREKREGRQAAERELMEKFGVTTVEEAQEILNRAKTADDALKTQAQKDADKAAADKAQAEADRKEAAKDRLQAKIERALQKAGLEDEGEIEEVAKLIAVEPDADADAIKAAVDALKTKMPRLFPEVQEELGPDGKPIPKPPVKKVGGPVHSAPPKTPPVPPQGNTADRAKQLLAERHPSKVKKTP